MAANRIDQSRLLSVQSHVVSGYVGNRSATFPLQLLGWDVDVANTVQFSNHTGYGRWGGVRFDAEHLQDLFSNLEKNGLLRYSRMLTGYMPSAAVVNTVLDLVKKLRSRDGAEEALIYLLDPVMGDMGRGMYVAPEVLPAYQRLSQYSTIITPNQFEAQALTGLEITNLASLKRVILTLHTQHKVPHVIITSVDLPEEDLNSIGAKTVLEDGRTAMLQVGSSCEIKMDSQGNRIPPSITDTDLQVWMIQFPEVQGYFSGVGDMFAALTLGRFQPNATSPAEPQREIKPLTPIARASELAIASLQGILKNTCQVIDQIDQLACTTDASQIDEAQNRVDTMRKRELRVVQSKAEIENPDIIYHAKWIS